MLQSKTEKALKYVSKLELPARVLEGMTQPAGYLVAARTRVCLWVGHNVLRKGRDARAASGHHQRHAARPARREKARPDASDIDRWYDQYFDVLSNIGWLIQDRQFATYAESGEGFEAQQAIIDIATALLGPTAAALAVVQSALASLKSMADSSR